MPDPLIDPAKLEALKAAAEKATKGPWSLSDGWEPDEMAIVDTQNVYGAPPAGVVAHVVRAAQDGLYTEEMAATARLIALCDPDTILALLAELERRTAP